MSCCGKKIPVSSSLAIQNARRSQTTKLARTNVCQQLEKAGKTLSVTIKAGALYLTQPFQSDIPVENSLVSMGCVGTNAKLIRSLALEIAVIYKNPEKLEKFEKNLQHTTVTLVALEQLINMCR